MMQTAPSKDSLTEVTLESRIPVSTLRSTASPYKHNRTDSLFSLYLSQLTSDSLCTSLDFSKPSGVPSTQSFSFSSRPLLTTRSASSTNASNEVKDGLKILEDRYTRSEVDFVAGSAFDTASTRPSSPLAAMSSPSSAAADISSFESLQDSSQYDNDDGETESDRPDSPAPPSTFHSSPFSSPLSSAPGSPATTLITIISPKCVVSTTTTRPTAPKALHEQFNNKHSRQKRPRSPSPSLIIDLPTRRARASKPSKRLEVQTQASSRAPRPSREELSPRSTKTSKDLIGPLIQVLALSGKSSTPTSSVVNEMLSATPSLRAERTIEEWKELALVTMSGNDVFGRAERKGLKNAGNEMVEDEWYYRPENDDDVMRRGTLGTFQRGGGKRRATLQKRQYYWKPVK